MFLKLFDPVYITSHLIFVKICPTVSLCFYAKNKPKIVKIPFHAVLNNPIKKQPPHRKKNLRWSKIGRGGGPGYVIPPSKT